MFERFTEEARRVVVLAQEEARDAGDPFIDGAHLLLGIAEVPGPGRAALQDAGVQAAALRRAIRDVGSPSSDALDADALAALGIDLTQVRAAAEAIFGSGALDDRRRRRWGRGPRRVGGHLPFTDTSKKALELSLRAAVRRGDRSLDTRHLLLGLLTAEEKRSTAALRSLAVDPAQLRSRLEDDSDAA
jgi:ATP-dependent Clp protease ATP-binding subunit ClpA